METGRFVMEGRKPYKGVVRNKMLERSNATRKKGNEMGQEMQEK